MAAHITSIDFAGSTQWRYTLTGTAPFDIYYDGELYDTTSSTNVIIDSNTDDAEYPPDIEVLDANDSNTPYTISNPPIAKIQWFGNASARLYVIQQYVDAAWTTVSKVLESGLGGYYTYTTTALVDSTTHQFRIYSQDTEGVTSYEVPVNVLIVRNPAPPQLTFTYSAVTNKITMEARV